MNSCYIKLDPSEACAPGEYIASDRVDIKGYPIGMSIVHRRTGMMRGFLCRGFLCKCQDLSSNLVISNPEKPMLALPHKLKLGRLKLLENTSHEPSLISYRLFHNLTIGEMVQPTFRRYAGGHFGGKFGYPCISLAQLTPPRYQD